MKKLLHVAALCVLCSVVFAPTAMAQGNDISCPPGSAANAAGTRCTDLATGEQVDPISQVVGPGESALTNPCPELYTKAADGRCVPVGSTSPAPAPEQPAPEAKAEAPKTESETSKSLPKSGGPGSASLMVLGAGAILVGGGLLLRRIAR